MAKITFKSFESTNIRKRFANQEEAMSFLTGKSAEFAKAGMNVANMGLNQSFWYPKDPTSPPVPNGWDAYISATNGTEFNDEDEVASTKAMVQ